MKGKGKGDRTAGSGAKDKDGNDLKECPLSFPDLTPIDHTQLCPRFTSILARDESESVAVDEIDVLQKEYETLLVAVAKRMRTLETEIQVLNNWQDGKIMPRDSPAPASSKGKGSGKGTSGASNELSGKRSLSGKDEKPSKKLKESSGKGSQSKGGSKGKVQKEKERPSEVTGTPKSSRGKADSKFEPTIKQEFDSAPAADSPSSSSPLGPSSTGPLPPLDLPKLKVDIPNRFWSIVDPYCSDITPEDIKVLEDLVRSQEDDSEFYKIPPLGKHYADKWAQQDLMEEQADGAKLSDKKCNPAEVSGLLKMDDDSSPFGHITQRLVQALMEENFMAPSESDEAAAEMTEAASISPKSLAQQLNIGNPVALERKIKQQLEEIGILEAEDDIPDGGADDEIVLELRKKQQELKALMQHNQMVIKRMMRQAKEEMARQELRKKMTHADNEVMEAYRKIQAARAKKKSPSKKEMEMAKKALKEREVIVRQLESAIL